MVVARKGRGTRTSAGGRVVERDLGWAEVKERTDEMKHSSVRVGVLAAAGVHKDGSGLTMAEIATVHEYGAPEVGIPRRSFIGSAIDEGRDELRRAGTAAARSVVDGRRTVDQALALVGEKARAMIVNKINRGPFVPNAPLTIALKGSSKPLIDTGQLKQSVSYEIVRGGSKGGTR